MWQGASGESEGKKEWKKWREREHEESRWENERASELPPLSSSARRKAGRRSAVGGRGVPGRRINYKTRGN